MKMKWNTSRRGCEKDQENKNGTIQLQYLSVPQKI
jgi:hypothetical protein